MNTWVYIVYIDIWIHDNGYIYILYRFPYELLHLSVNYLNLHKVVRSVTTTDSTATQWIKMNFTHATLQLFRRVSLGSHVELGIWYHPKLHAQKIHGKSCKLTILASTLTHPQNGSHLMIPVLAWQNSTCPPSRERSHIPPKWEKENHWLKKCLFGVGYGDLYQ